MKKIFFLCFIMLNILAKAQYVPMNAAGYDFKGVKADTLLFTVGCGAPVTTPGNFYHYSSIFYDSCGKGFYVYDPSTYTWALIGSGDASFPIYVDTLFSIDDSTFRWCKGLVCHDIPVKGGQFIFSCPGSGELITNTLDIYHENVEWTTSVSGAELNAASTNLPCNGSKSIEGTTVGNNDFINFTAPSVPDYTAYNYLVFKISSKATWTTGQRIRFRWLNGSSAVGVGVNFTDGSYGFKSNITDSCQLIYIPLGAFGTITGADKLHVEGSITSSGTIGFYIDDIVLQQSNVSAVFGSAISWDQTMRNSPDISQDYFSHFNSSTWTMDSILQLRIHVQDWVDIIGDKDAGREYMLKMHVNDGGNSLMAFANATVANGRFAPLIVGYQSPFPSPTTGGDLSFRGLVHPDNDIGGDPVFQFVAAGTHSDSDPNAPPLYKVNTKDIFAIGDSDLQYFMVKASGQLQFPMYVGGAFSGTAAYGLGLDALGNVIVTDTSSGGGGGTDLNFAMNDLTATGDRHHNWAGHGFLMDSIGTFDLVAGDPTFSGQTSEIYLESLSAQLFSQSDNIHYSQAAVSTGGVDIGSTDDGGTTTAHVIVFPDSLQISSINAVATTIISVTPTTAKMQLNNAASEYLPLSVNGVYADAAGNIDISGGGGTPNLQQVLDVGHTAANQKIQLYDNSGHLIIDEDLFPTGVDKAWGLLQVNNSETGASTQMVPDDILIQSDIAAFAYADLLGDKFLLLKPQYASAGSKTLFYPDATTNSTLAVSVNGVFADAAGNIDLTGGGGGTYKEYVAIVTQVGTSNPTAIVLSNTYASTPVWTRSSTGTYDCTFSTPELVDGKTVVFGSVNSTGGGDLNFGGINNGSSDSPTFTTFQYLTSSNTLFDNMNSDMFIVRTYQ